MFKFNFTLLQKQIIIGVKMVVFAVLSWFFLHQLFYSEISIVFIVLTALFMIFWGATVCVGILLLDKKILYPVFTLSLLSFLIFFQGSGVGPFQFREALYYFLIMILIFLTFLIFRTRVKQDKKIRLKMNVWRILIKKGLALMFTMICLLIALAYYFSPALGEISTNSNFEVPRSIIDTVLKPFSGLDEDLGDVVYEFVNSQIGSREEIFTTYAPIALALVLFLSLRAIVIILVPLIVLLSMLSIKLSTALGFIKITTKSMKAEDFEL